MNNLKDTNMLYCYFSQLKLKAQFRLTQNINYGAIPIKTFIQLSSKFTNQFHCEYKDVTNTSLLFKEQNMIWCYDASIYLHNDITV